MTLLEDLDELLDGILVCNLEELKLLHKISYNKQIIGNHNLYVYNREAKAFYRDLGVQQFTVPLELNYKEMEDLGIRDCECVIYGYEPVMITAQCLEKTCRGCTKNPGFHMLKDRYQKQFIVKNDCTFCYNKIYNTEPLMLFGEIKDLDKLNPCSYRLVFTKENQKEIEDIMLLYTQSVVEMKDISLENYSYTKGHFRRGVK